MSSKINVTYIIKQHFNTLRDASNNKVSFKDVFVFLILPLLLSSLVFFGDGLSKEMFSLAVNFGAISTALLMSVLVLVYDQEAKIKYNIEVYPERYDGYRARLSVLRELYQNICYTIVVSILLVMFSVIGMSVLGNCVNVFFNLVFFVSSFLVVFMFSNIVITMLMVIKRFHALLTH